jgi:hypothetical protein
VNIAGILPITTVKVLILEPAQLLTSIPMAKRALCKVPTLKQAKNIASTNEMPINAVDRGENNVKKAIPSKLSGYQLVDQTATRLKTHNGTVTMIVSMAAIAVDRRNARADSMA